VTSISQRTGLVDLPDSADTINAPYMAALLSRYSGEPEQAVTNFSVQRLERGTSGAQLHVISVHRTTDSEPLTFILKIKGGQDEVFFYRDLASRLPVDTPRVLDARILDDGRAWLIMEEITGVKDDLTWSEDDYRAILSDMARLHAQYWSQTNLLDDCPWLWRPDEQSLQALIAARRSDLEAISASWLPQALPEVFGADRLALARDILEQPNRLFGPMLDAGTTLVHGDYWFHNVLVTSAGRRVLVDWQDPQIWSGLWELAYFLNLLLAIGPADYREELPFAEDIMISWYSDALDQVGVTLPKSVFDKALLSARVWHPIQHWVRQYSYVATQNPPIYSIQEKYPGAVRFLANTFARWDQDVHTLLAV